MAREWIMVRLQRDTHAALEAVRVSLIRAHEAGKIALEFDSAGRVSLDQVITVLLRGRSGHAERRKKSATKKRKTIKSGVNGSQVPHE